MLQRPALRAIRPVVKGIRRLARPVVHRVAEVTTVPAGLMARLVIRLRLHVRKLSPGRPAAPVGPVTRTTLRVPTPGTTPRRLRLRGTAVGRKQS